jgi:mannose-6-phosphate isomerase-like protein (cupin superfamily)
MPGGPPVLEDVLDAYQRRSGTTAYDRWIEKEAVPVHSGLGIDDVATVELGRWDRLSCHGAYLELLGSESTNGAYVLEVPPGGKTTPERHLFEEVMFCVSGKALVSYWRDHAERAMFECQEGANFASPLNVWHQFQNPSTTESARFLAVTSAPATFRLLGSPEPIYDNDFTFTDRFDGGADFFTRAPNVVETRARETVMTNLVPDIGTFHLMDIPQEASRGEGWRQRKLLLAGNRRSMVCAEFPGARYSLAHHHEPGFFIYIPRGQGFTLMWPKEAGVQPYESGYGDKVVRFDFHERSLYAPPRGWYHNHFNVAEDPYMYVAVGPTGDSPPRIDGIPYDVVSITKGGTQIDRDIEDPMFRRIFDEELEDRVAEPSGR